MALDALAEYLLARYVVDVDRRTVDQETHLVLRPSTGAPVTIMATVESAEIQGGALFRARVPQCSCDACDESAESVVADAEDTLLAITAGGLREVFPVGHRRGTAAQIDDTLIWLARRRVSHSHVLRSRAVLPGVDELEVEHEGSCAVDVDALGAVDVRGGERQFR